MRLSFPEMLSRKASYLFTELKVVEIRLTHVWPGTLLKKHTFDGSFRSFGDFV